MKQTIHGPAGIRLELDSDEIFPADPGQGTPAIVVLTDCATNRELGTATFHCANDTGEIDGYKLNAFAISWLYLMEPVVEEFILTHSKG